MDFSFVEGYASNFYKGFFITLEISIIAVVGAVLFGTLIYFMKGINFHIGKIYPIRLIINVFIEIMRGTPVLLQILIAYSGSKMLLNLNVSPFAAATFAIMLNSSVYVAEIIRGGIESIPVGQMEAARSLGMTKVQGMFKVVVPQAIKNILPPIGNEFVGIIKSSSMASTIGVAELTFSAKIVQGATYLSMEPLIIAGVYYFVLTFVLGRLMQYIERRMKASDLR